MISPGTHDVIQKSAKEWIKIGIAKEVKEEKKTSTPPPVTTAVITPPKEGDNAQSTDDMTLEELQSAAKKLDIETDGKDAETLKAEIDLAKELDLKEE